MSERLEALKTTRQRMIEDRDTYVKVLTATRRSEHATDSSRFRR
jgi:hypothetical protein